MDALVEEIETFGDLVVLRGHESYKSLPEKVANMLLFALADDTAYTHILKVDDDVYIRGDALLRRLYGVEWGVSISNSSASTPFSVEVEHLERMNPTNPIWTFHHDDPSSSSSASASASASASSFLSSSSSSTPSTASPIFAHYGGFRHATIRPRWRGMYMGKIENFNGFRPVRRSESKWFISRDTLPDDEVPWGSLYVAGWAYLVRYAV